MIRQNYNIEKLELDAITHSIDKEYNIGYDTLSGTSRNWEVARIRCYFILYAYNRGIQQQIIARYLKRAKSSMTNLIASLHLSFMRYKWVRKDYDHFKSAMDKSLTNKGIQNANYSH